MFDDFTHFLHEGEALCRSKTAKVGGYTWTNITCPRCLALRDHDLSKPLPQAPPPEATRESNKREPCYHDDDRMPFGKWRGERVGDVPADYFHWLWTQRPIRDVRLENYIFNNITALKQEYPDGIWT